MVYATTHSLGDTDMQTFKPRTKPATKPVIVQKNREAFTFSDKGVDGPAPNVIEYKSDSALVDAINAAILKNALS